MMEVFLLAVERSCNLEGDVILNLQQLKLTEAQEHNRHQLNLLVQQLIIESPKITLFFYNVF